MKRQVYQKVMTAFCKHRKGPSVKNSEKCHLLYIMYHSKGERGVRTLWSLSAVHPSEAIFHKAIPPATLSFHTWLVLRVSPNRWCEVGPSSHVHTAFPTSFKGDTFWTLNKYRKQKLSSNYSFPLNVRINRIEEKKWHFPPIQKDISTLKPTVIVITWEKYQYRRVWEVPWTSGLL